MALGFDATILSSALAGPVGCVRCYSEEVEEVRVLEHLRGHVRIRGRQRGL